ncbi:MAG: hypothetical protein ACYSUV_11425 [Planctomycetota bacterium]
MALDFALGLVGLAFVFLPALQPQVLHICHPFTFDIQYRLGGATAFVCRRYVSRPAGANQSRFFGLLQLLADGILRGALLAGRGGGRDKERLGIWGRK